LPSVVVLIARDANGKAVTLGSGFFVTSRIVATNLHVIEDASRVTARLLNGNKNEYEINGTVAIDEENDLVLLRAQTGVEPDLERYLDPIAKPLSLAKNNRGQIGDEVYVIGNPEGLEGTFSQGIISAFRGTDYIQITAPISPGSSGGPVIDHYGEVIGVATSFSKEGQNLNFAIPVSKLFLLLANSSHVKPFSPRAILAFDGLYGATFQQMNGSEIIQWFRFHQDGSVFSTWANPTESTGRIFDGLAAGGNIHKYQGRYLLRGSNIEFRL
jgi:S1-C subfamily serine protease